MASVSPCQAMASKSQFLAPSRLKNGIPRTKPCARVVCAVGDVSAEGTSFLIAGAVAVALIGTALPVLFYRRDLCPVCDGAGFVRKTGATLNANAARKDLDQIVCKNCNGLGKVGQVDKVVRAAAAKRTRRY